MSARVLFLCLAVALTGYGAAYFLYARSKLELLEPLSLTPHPVWAGPEDAPRRLLLLGDSRISQWPLQPPPGWRIGKVGFSGQAAVNIEPAVRAVLAQARPDAVVIQAGGNDATAAVFQSGAARARTLAQAAQATLAIAARAREAGAARIIVLTIVPPIATELWKRALMGTKQEEMFGVVSREIRSGALAQGFEILDADALFRDAGGRLRSDYRRDSLHWSPAGYTALDAALFQRLERPAPGGAGR